MQITSSMVFFLLERKFILRYPAEDPAGVVITEPRLLESPELEPGILYIVDKPEILAAVEHPGSCAFLLCGAAGKWAAEDTGETRELPPWLPAAHAACVEEDLSPDNLLKSVFSLFLSLQDWDCRLKDASFESSADYTRIFRIAREFFDVPFALIDRNFTVVEKTPDTGTGLKGYDSNYLPMNMVNTILLKNDEHYRVSELVEPYLYSAPSAAEQDKNTPWEKLLPERYLCCNIFRGSYFEGRIVAFLFEPNRNHPGRSQLLSHLCIYAGKVFINTTDDMLAKRQNDPLHQLVRNSIFNTEGVPERNAAGVLGELSWQINNPYLLVAFQIADEHRFTHGALYVCRRLETDVLHSCAITYTGHIIWLINTEDIAQRNIKRNYQQIIAFIVREYHCKAGVSRSFNNFMELRDAYTQAMAALRLGYKRDPQPGMYRFTDYVLDYILERTISELPAEQLLHPGAVSLWNLDKNTGTDYIKTLRYYMDFQYNMTAAAEKLFVHRTTLIRRLERITEITGLNYKKPRDMLQMAISLYLLTPPEPAGVEAGAAWDV
jgi:hypothetical protein